MDIGPITYLEIDGQDVTDCIRTEPSSEAAWAMTHQLHVFNQMESRPGQPNDKGERWTQRRLTGKSIAACSCGYTTGLVDRDQLPPIEELAAEHPRTI